VTRKVDVRLPGKGNSNSHGARPVHLTITIIKWIRTSRLSIKNSLSEVCVELAQEAKAHAKKQLTGKSEAALPEAPAAHTVLTTPQLHRVTLSGRLPVHMQLEIRAEGEDCHLFGNAYVIDSGLVG